MKVIFIFIDGLGIGTNDPSKNPAAHSDIQLMRLFQTDQFPKAMPYGGLVKAIDCHLGLPGLPQSATGQSALFTGVNAVQLLGCHLSGFPNQTLRNLLATDSILLQFKHRKKKPAFINAYRPIFFQFGPEMLIRHLSVTSIMNWKAGLHFFNFQELAAEQALYHDFTNLELINKGYRLPAFTAEHAGQILAQISQAYDFCLYEYFKTDHAGHAQNLNDAVVLLKQLEQFIESLLTRTDLTETLVVLCSDHGNIEDLNVKTHTNNPVPLIAWGPRNSEFLSICHALTDVTPALIALAEN
ncbi:MAG: hypothetical protein ONB16_03780 [candidate division KSB1 bacterium]|nr:hypothetical protein [candidate division KSB1 bacterium]MDZ7319739.1 hypothetical protein [candidate division KSB1 bacterium]MDZ7342271.1 hypothetical protein [candidate division KSB1 bacterium]